MIRLSWPHLFDRSATLAKGWRLPTTIAGVLASTLVLALLPDFFVLPRLANAQPVAAPTVVLGCLVCGLLIARVIDEPLPVVAQASSRPVALIALIRLLLCLGVAVVALTTLGHAPLAITSLTLVTVVSEAVLFAALTSKTAGWALPVGHLSAGLTFGATSGHLATWAWPLDAHPSTTAWTLTTLVAAVAACVLVRRRRRR